MGISRESWAGFCFTAILAGVGVIIAVVSHGYGIAVGLMLVAVGVLGIGVIGYIEARSPRRMGIAPLVKMMREGRAIRDSMGIGRANPNNPVNEGRCREWESATSAALMKFDAHLAESCLLGNPEIDPNPPHHEDGINWRLFMQGRLNQLDKAIRELRQVAK